MWGSKQVENIENKKIIKKTIQNQIITLSLATVSSVSFTIDNLTFTPDKMNVKSILFRDGAGSSVSNYIILSDLTDWKPIAYFNDQMTQASYLNIEFYLNKQINGTYNFKFVDYLLNPVNVDGYLTLHLEFSTLN